MKKYTQEEFNNFEIVNGRKQCPTGDYSDIKVFNVQCSFGGGCSFGEWCSFGEQCSFGEGCIIENKYTLISLKSIEGIGSAKRKTYFFTCDEGLFVRCGCFFGTLEDFEAKVQGTHKNNPQYLKEYMGAINYIKTIQ